MKRIQKEAQIIYKLFVVIPLVVFFLFSAFTLFDLNKMSKVQNKKIVQEYNDLLILELLRDQSSQFEKFITYSKYLSDKSNFRISLIKTSGEVLWDSEFNASLMKNHLDRDEVKNSLLMGYGEATRKSETIGKEFYYFARKVNVTGIEVILRTALPLDFFNQKIADFIYRMIFSLGFIVIILLFAKRHLELLVEKKIVESHSQNEGSKAIVEELRREQSQTSLLKLAMSSIRMPLVLFDREFKITYFNQAMESVLLENNLFGLKTPIIHEIFRSHELLEVCERVALKNEHLSELEVPLFDGRRYLTNVTNLGETNLLTLNDITRLKQLEIVRRDFVSNVSHELKTPLTAIKAAAESVELQDNTQKRFLEMIVFHVDRLAKVTEDLLMLSMLEESGDNLTKDFQSIVLSDLVNEAFKIVAQKIEDAQITIVKNGDFNLTLFGNRHLLVLSFVNLLENAIKYGGANQKIEIYTTVQRKIVTLSVKDNGPGIPSEHHSRLFERFYCVNRARSRELGGTGLGLALVKNIMLLHNGEVTLLSDMGSGSTFSLSLPKVTL